MSIAPEKRRSCSDSALKCFGTAYIFEKKARKLKRFTIVSAQRRHVFSSRLQGANQGKCLSAP